MGNRKIAPMLLNGEVWPLRYIADPTVAKINPNYAAEIGKTYPFVPMENVRENCEGLSGFEYRMLDAGGYTFFKAGDILFAKITPCAENGKIAQVRSVPGEVGFGSTEFIVFSPDPAVDARFIYYQLSREDIRSLCVALMEGTTGRQRVPTSIFRTRIQIPIPPSRAEQHTIACFLEMVDSVIAATRESIAKAERLQKGLMQHLLTGRLKPDGTPCGESDWREHPRFGHHPATWRVGRAKEYFVLQRGFDLPDADARPGSVPVVKSNGIENYHNKHKVLSPGVVTGRSGTIGNVFYIEQPFWPHNTALYVKDFCGNEPMFIYFLLKSLHLERHLAGTTIPTLNRNDIHRLWITAPTSTNEQHEIAAVLHNCELLIRAKEHKIDVLQRLRNR